MKIRIKNGSIIYKLATLLEDDLPTTFCGLFWTLLFNSAILAFLITITGTYFGYITAALAASVSVGYMVWTIPIVVTVFAILLLLTILLIAFLHITLKDIVDENPEGKVSNMSVMYFAWKEKFCPLVEEIEDKKSSN